MIRRWGLLVAVAVIVAIGGTFQSGPSLANQTVSTPVMQKPLWWIKLDPISDRPPTQAGYPDFAVDERNAYVLKQGQVEARDLTTGRTIWRVRGSRQVLTDGTRVFTFSGDRLMAVDARNGRMVWSVRYDNLHAGSFQFPRNLCACLYVSKDLLLGYGVAIDAKTGRTRWKLKPNDLLGGGDGGLVGATDAYIVWQASFSGAYSGDSFRFFRRSDGQERTFDKKGVYTSQCLGFDTQGRFFELFVPLREPLNLPLELRRYDLSTATISDTYGKFDVNPRPGCLWTVQVYWFAYRLVRLTAENIVLATEDSCGKYAVVIPSSLKDSTRTVEWPLSVESRQELLGESRGVAVARTSEHLIQLAIRPSEVLALFDNPLRLESLSPEDGRSRTSRILPYPTARAAGKDVTWMLARAVVVANGDTVSVYLNK